MDQGLMDLMDRWEAEPAADESSSSPGSSLGGTDVGHIHAYDP